MPKVPKFTTTYSAINWIVGIDPGKAGAIVAISKSTNPEIKFMGPLSDDPVVIVNTLDQLLEKAEDVKAEIEMVILEKVGGYVGGTGQPGSSMFNFGKVFGYVHMLLVCEELPYELIASPTWQKGLQIPSRDKKSETPTDHKRKLKSKAQQLFPKFRDTITLKNCDALLLAEFGRRKFSK